MFKRKFLSFLLLLSFVSAFSQKDAVLFTVNGEKVYSSEFSRVYEKNLSLVTDPSQKDLDNYLDLYINYKLKLQEAYQLKMDTVGAYQREYAKYENQLIQPYLKDENFEKDLLKEAYERSKKEVNASHILITVEKGQDTLVAYQKALDIRDRILKGEDFAKVAKEVSQDPSAARNEGNLGYFTVFQMVYPFENAAYTTKIGEISMPVKTQFGYHLVKVNDVRDSKGEVEVAHIMLKGDYEKNQPLIENLKKQLDEGADFSELAKNYSQDGGTAKNGGLLPRFGSGRMIPSFESVAFSLQNEGDISEPFKTEFGWHIIKLVKKYPIGSFEEMEPELKQKIDQGQRAQLIGNSVVKRLLKEYQINYDASLLNEFSKTGWEENSNLQKKNTLLTIEGTQYAVKDFFDYYKNHKSQPVQTAFDAFKEEKILDIYKSRLPQKFPELKETMKEYREGLLLFDLMQKKIWDRAEKDTMGLQSFFDVHSNNYKWGQRAKMYVATLKNNDSGKIIQAISEGVETDSIWSQFHEENLIDIREDSVETTSDNFPKGLKTEEKSDILVPVANQYKLYYVKEILPETPKKLEEVKGKVMSDYQDQLEKDWIQNLRNTYKVKVNKKTLEALKSKYNS